VSKLFHLELSARIWTKQNQPSRDQIRSRSDREADEERHQLAFHQTEAFSSDLKDEGNEDTSSANIRQVNQFVKVLNVLQLGRTTELKLTQNRTRES
jgi:hypothetical protein